MNNSLKQGMNLSLKKMITDRLIAANQDLGDNHYASTPSLLLLMEQTCNVLLDKHLPKEHTSITAEINIKHTKPILIDQTVTTSVHLKYIDDEKLFFDFVLMDDENDVIAIGAHERIIVDKNNLVLSPSKSKA